MQARRSSSKTYGHDGHLAWSPQQPTDLVFADGLQDVVSSI
jgi:hypothetical protein